MSKHELEIAEVIEKIKDLNAEKVGLQFPEGLKVHATKIAGQIEQETGAVVIISADPCYGACDVADVDMMDSVDVLVHFGHRPLPLDYDLPIIFVDARSNMDVLECVKSSMDMLEGYKRIGLVTTAQHLHLLEEVSDFLEKNGKGNFNARGCRNNKRSSIGL